MQMCNAPFANTIVISDDFSMFQFLMLGFFQFVAFCGI